MTRLILAGAWTLACIASAANAQTPVTPQPQGRSQLLPPARVVTPNPPPAPVPPPAPALPPAASKFQSVNMKVEFVITDQRGTEAPVKRIVSVIASDGFLGRVRSVATAIIAGAPTQIPLNVDATPTLLASGQIRLQFTLAYDLPAPSESSPGAPRITTTTLQDSVTLVLTDGKSVVAAQSADPIGDRQVTVEVKATIMK